MRKDKLRKMQLFVLTKVIDLFFVLQIPGSRWLSGSRVTPHSGLDRDGFFSGSRARIAVAGVVFRSPRAYLRPSEEIRRSR